jgi:siderophore synthetase component
MPWRQTERSLYHIARDPDPQAIHLRAMITQNSARFLIMDVDPYTLQNLQAGHMYPFTRVRFHARVSAALVPLTV